MPLESRSAHSETVSEQKIKLHNFRGKSRYLITSAKEIVRFLPDRPGGTVVWDYFWPAGGDVDMGAWVPRYSCGWAVWENRGGALRGSAPLIAECQQRKGTRLFKTTLSCPPFKTNGTVWCVIKSQISRGSSQITCWWHFIPSRMTVRVRRTTIPWFYERKTFGFTYLHSLCERKHNTLPTTSCLHTSHRKCQRRPTDRFTPSTIHTACFVFQDVSVWIVDWS